MSKTFNFSSFMRNEFALYSKDYATNHVSITGEDKLDRSKGGVLLFLHFGSFFLSGVSLISKLSVNYTAIASTRNFSAMRKGDAEFWKDVHKTANKLYSRKMFLSDGENTSEMLSYISEGNFIGSAVDVAEIGKKHKFRPFTFLHNKVYLQTAPARLASISKVPLYGMTIVYDSKKDHHTLHITGPYDSQDVDTAIQGIISDMEPIVRNNTDQLFHDVFRLFSFSGIKDHLITPAQKKESIGLVPLKRLKTELPKSFSPRYESNITAWHPHRDFAYSLIKEIQPKVIVELGVHYGDSYFTFCQACEELELETQLFGVDHWRGDKQAGFYGDDVFKEVNQYNREFHSQNSSLHRMHFEEALNLFEDGSIDLLHIDGSHDYKSVKKDFEDWLPKIKKGGRILIHDILVEREDFGVKKLWKEIQKSYQTESHNEGFGLGVISFQ